MDRQLTFKQRILAAATLFGMFFGPASLIFPVHLGQLAGSNVIPAAIGFLITAVSLPILGVAAIAVTHSDGLQGLANNIGKGYSYFFTCLLYLAIGPFFAIPRCATISFTTGIVPMLDGKNDALVLLIFSVLLFAIVLFCSLHPAGIKVWIGKVITPLFLLFFAILVITALLKPSTSIALRNALHLDRILALAQKCLPLFSLNLGWILPAIIGFIVGLSIRALRKHRKP